MVSLTFEQPEYLWFLLALPLMLVTHFYVLRNAKHRALAFANFAVLKRALGHKHITKNYTVLALRMLIIVCATLAIAGTVLWYEGSTNENEFVIALDTSASMSAQDVAPDRLGAAKTYAQQFIEDLDANTRVGLVSFSGVTFIEQPLTTDRGDLAASLSEIEISASGTDIAGAVITSTNLLVPVERGRAIILISDGSNTIETFQSRSLQRAIQYAKINRVKIYTIGVGGDQIAPIGYLPTYYNVSATYNNENLQYIANETNATAYAARNADELARAYADIKAADKTSTLRYDLAPGLLLLTFVLLLVEWGLLSTRFRMLP